MDIVKVQEKAKNLMVKNRIRISRESGYSYYHGTRVANLAVTLRKHLFPDVTGYDDIIKAAGYFHDAGKGMNPHNIYGAVIAREALKEMCTPDELNLICEIITNHCNKGTPNEDHFTSKLIQDADEVKVRLGGCLVREGNPEYYCEDCENEWNRMQAEDEAYNKIKAVKASVGGYFGGRCSVDIDLKELKSTWNFSEGGIEETLRGSIHPSTAEYFIEQMKAINLLDWKARYMEPGVCDGTQWSVEIETEYRTFKKYGSNKFPEEWELFCSVIETVTGRAFR
jgi:hypothetical protein